MKKLVILGRGTAGAISAARATHEIIRKKNCGECEIEWMYDPEIQTQAVGEGTTLNVADCLFQTLDFYYSDMPKIDANYKKSILKHGWGSNQKQFGHEFFPPFMSFHINAVKLQQYVFDTLKNRNYPNVKFIERNTTSDKIDADYIIDCSGTPKQFDDKFVMATDIPVNSVYVTQCYWDQPKFHHSLCIALKHGWVFGIPLQNRCSIGYMYNNKMSTLEEVKEDVQQMFARYDLTPSNNTNAFSFSNYYRNQTFSKNIAYNGNCSFFLEPLEATTLSYVNDTAITALKFFEKSGYVSDLMVDYHNALTSKAFEETIDMISFHYFAGSTYQSKFWEFAKQKGYDRISNSLKNNRKFYKMMEKSILSDFNYSDLESSYGGWATRSWYDNMIGLGIRDQIKQLL